jgi:hypothetical protein
MAVPTLDQVVDTLLENADFAEVQSLAKAKAFATAAKQFFILTPSSSSDQGSALSVDLNQIRWLAAQANDYIRASSESAASSSSRAMVPAEDFRR